MKQKSARRRARVIHETDPLRGQPCGNCGRVLRLGQTVTFDEDDGGHPEHMRCWSS